MQHCVCRRRGEGKWRLPLLRNARFKFIENQEGSYEASRYCGITVQVPSETDALDLTTKFWNIDPSH